MKKPSGKNAKYVSVPMGGRKEEPNDNYDDDNILLPTRRDGRGGISRSRFALSGAAVVALVKRASARQVVSQSPGWWTSNPWPKTTRDDSKLIVAGIEPTVEGTPDNRSQPRRREETETGPSLEGTPETRSMVSQHESK